MSQYRYISPQIQILRAILFCGVEATTDEIMNFSGLTRAQIHASCRHLLSRGFIKRERRRRKASFCVPPYLPTLWKLRPQKRMKIITMLKESYPEEFNG